MTSNKDLQWDARYYQNHSQFQFQLGLMAIERLNPQDCEKILEIGCGNGLLTVEIAKKIPNGEIIAIEISKEMIKLAQENAKLNGLENIKFLNMDAIEISFKNEFDAVFSNSAIHWIKKIKLMYKKIYDALKPNGRIINQTGLREKGVFVSTIIKLFQIKRFKPYFSKLNIPWNFLTKNKNMKILQDANFSNISIETYLEVHEFESKEALYGHFKAAAMVPFLSVLPDELKKDFEETFMRIYLIENDQKLDLKNTRLFISAQKTI